MIDIVIPSNNEEDFILMAGRLGYSGVYFLYTIEEYLANRQSRKTGAKNKVQVYNGVLSDKNSMSKAKNKAGKETFVATISSDRDREIIEGSLADMIFSFEETCRKDFVHHRASGLNHIMCKSARKNNILIGFSLSSILFAQDKGTIIGRMIQNIGLCKKFKVKNAVASFARNPYEMRSPHDIQSLFQIISNETLPFLQHNNKF